MHESEVATEAISRRRSQALESLAVLGVDAFNVEFHSFRDNRMDEVPLLDIVKIIEKKVQSVVPDLVFTHFPGDLNIDHQLTSRATATACRPLPGHKFNGLFYFEVASNTEYGQVNGMQFAPNVYVNINEHIETKLEAFNHYIDEVRVGPHPRSQRYLKALAIKRGGEVGVDFAEAFLLERYLFDDH